MLTFEPATLDDAETITAVQIRTFDDDSRRFLGRESGGPPKYDSVAWMRARIAEGMTYKIGLDGDIVGALILFRLPEPGAYMLGRIFIAPEQQNRGIGAAALRFVDTLYPDARRWILDTPTWATRNHHFYEAHGYRRTHVEGDSVWYEKLVPVQA